MHVNSLDHAPHFSFAFFCQVERRKAGRGGDMEWKLAASKVGSVSKDLEQLYNIIYLDRNFTRARSNEAPWWRCKGPFGA